MLRFTAKQEGESDVNDPESLARSALQLMDEGRLDEWEQTMEPDCEFIAPGSTLQGRKAVREFGFRRAFPDVRHKLESVYAVGETVIVEVTMTMTQTGPLQTPSGEIPSTGKSVRIREAQIVEMRNGKAAVLRTYFDRMEMMAQLGSMPHRPGAE